MRKILLLISLALFEVCDLSSQETPVDTIQVGFVEPEDTTIYNVAEVMPEFPGGSAALQQFLTQNVRYPQKERERGMQGTVFISYVVEKDGSITNIMVHKGVEGAPGLGKEGVRIVSMFPKQSPGQITGKIVRVRMVIPIRFALN